MASSPREVETTESSAASSQTSEDSGRDELGEMRSLDGEYSLPAASGPARLLLDSPLTLAIRTWPECAVSVFGCWDARTCRLLSAVRTALW